MTEFVFVTLKDIHISDRNPRSRIDNYKESILDKLRQAGMACRKLNADGALIAGDLFNLKSPSRNSHRLNQDLIKVFREYECPIYMIEGNHDITKNQLESIEEQPLGVLFADKTLIQLREQIVEKNGVKISLVGIPYTEDLELSSLKIPSKEGCASQICLMHIYSGPKAGSFFKERLYGYDELVNLGPNIFVLGHYHIDQGVQTLDGKFFVNLGSISRGAISTEDTAHHPSLGLITIGVKDGGAVDYRLQYVKLKVKPVAEVFDMERRKEEEAEAQEIENFVTKLVEESGEIQVEDREKGFEEAVKDMDITKAVRDKVFHFIQEAAVKPK